MKATLLYTKGWKLVFPCNGRSAALFLEWYGNYLYSHRKDVFSLQFKIRREVPDSSEIDSDVFVVRFDVIAKEDAYNCRDYINANK